MLNRVSAIAIASLCAGPAFADGAALLIGNEDYTALNDVRRAYLISDSDRKLQTSGVEVQSLVDAESTDMSEALVEFENDAAGADSLLVALSGRFVYSSTDTYFLASNARPGPLTQIANDAIALSEVFALLAQSPGKAVLALATDERDGTLSPLLTYGIGDLDIPQGVTVVTGSPRAVAQAVSRTISTPGAALDDLADMRGINVAGYFAKGQVFLNAEEPVMEAQPITPEAGVDRSADIVAWRSADRTDTVEAYEGYIADFPNGQFVRMAEGRIEALTDTPEARAERTEQALDLTREQRQEIQRDLSLLDYNTRGIDGIFGRGTRAAITAWQSSNNFDATGFLTADQITRLDAQAERRATELEEEAERRRLEQLAKDQAFWEETGAKGDETGLRAYLNRYPDGEFSGSARTALEEIERQKRADTDARDRQLWDEARTEDTLQAYRDYLILAPDGAFVDEAQGRITELTREAEQSDVIRRAQQEENALNLSGNTRRVIESRLNRLGLEPGRVDGTFDDRTRLAIRRYQAARDLPETGYLNETVVVRLLADSVRSIFR